MSIFERIRAGAVALLVAMPGLAAPPATSLPSNSIYQLQVPLTSQRGDASALADWRGQPTLVTMFYTGCQFICPRIIDALKATENRLGPAERARVRVLVVTFDPRDDVAALARVMEERGLDTARWTLARTDDAHTRKLAAALGIKYRALPSGDFNHTSALILLDSDGRVAARTATLGAADPAFVASVKKALAP